MGPFARVSRWGVAVVLLLAALLLPGHASAAAPLDFGARQPILLDDAGQAWTDESSSLQVEDVARMGGVRWEPTSAEAIYPLHRGRSLWIRFSVPPTRASERWYLEVPYAGVDKVTLYSRDAAGRWQARIAGDSVPVAAWPVPHRHPVLPLQVSAAESQLHLLHVENGAAFGVPLRFVSESHLGRSEQRVSLALGVYFGLSALAVVLALVGAVTLRDRAYSLYGLSIVLMGATQAALTGLGGVHLWPDWAWWNGMAAHVMPLFAVSSLQLFFAEVVSLRDRSRVLYWLLVALAAASAPIAIAMMFSPDVEERLRMLVTYVILSTAGGLGVTAWAALRGDRYAPWLLLGVLPVAIGALAPIARASGLIPVSFWTNHVMQLMIAIELPVMLVLLALRSQHRREHVRRLQGLDRFDPATGLINATVFHERLVRLITRSQRSKVRSAMLLVDIANSDALRRRFGSDVSHEITLRVAGRLLSVAREIDTVARLSDHRFGILMEGPLRANEVAEAGPRVVARCLMPFPSRPLEWVPHVRVAQAVIPMDGTDPAQLVGQLELLLASAPADSRRSVFMLSRPPITRPAALTP
ncbi:7TM diverse intracellular signaling domain-containing protein [Ramlibacter sp. PS3R-8]|uniref:sensor domain-containing diguanylate cyclase n=1 Tax=Ramlibacter sp. PS3R-8 TaxID=3133437 RepID=UPI0030B1C354